MTKKEWNEFATPDVSSKYGAPMGRRGDRLADLDGFPDQIVLTRRVYTDGSYDHGGAYWGHNRLWMSYTKDRQWAMYHHRQDDVMSEIAEHNREARNHRRRNVTT